MARNRNNYRFNSLLVFNWDSPNNSERRYRQVFDRWELKYVGAELSFYNKKFDEEDWKATICFIAYSLVKDRKEEEVCKIEETFVIKSDENVVTINKGWGNDEIGKFWTGGDFIWEVSIDGDVVGEAKFYVQDYGIVKKNSNPYYDVISLKLYEGPDEDVPENERKYLRKFDTSQTRYIFGEFRFLNKVPKDWLCELYFNFFNDTGQLIGRIHSLQYVIKEKRGNDVFYISHGWGNKETNNWAEDEYTLEIEFLENIVAVVPFSVGEENKEDVSTDTIDSETTPDPIDWDEGPVPPAEADEKADEDDETARKLNLEDALWQLDELIGLDKIKEQIREHISYLDFLQVRKKLGFEDEEDLSLHSVFTGNPGTGKTTVVKLLGQIYRAMGLLSKGHVHTVDSSDLVSGYVRQTGGQTEEEIKKARGGILFIDEAYMLYKKGAENDFGSEAIASLITEMSDGEGDIAIMVAGYPAEMKDMIESNPGLKSRFKYYFHFDDYSPKELMAIAGYAADKNRVSLAPEALEAMEIQVTRAYRKRDKSFGNARFVHSIIEEAKINMGVRVMKEMKDGKVSKEMVSTILKGDIEEIFEDKSFNYIEIEPDHELLTLALRDLDRLVGLETIKQEVRNLVKLVRYYREIRKNVRKSFPIHLIFTGNPGTGKTTVARIMGNIYKALGILERGHVVECDASDLIAGFLGQTALKTKDKINEAMGGVLFIDEAYSLTDGQHPDFGRKAIETLIKQMEDKRGEFAVIVAGYTKPMQLFVESNPGIESRFDQTFEFRDFTQQELLDIGMGMFRDAEMTPDEAAREYLNDYLGTLYRNRNQFFGNARSVRKIVEKAVLNQNLRMASLEPGMRTVEMVTTITLEDLKDFRAETVAGSRSIGFKLDR